MAMANGMGWGFDGKDGAIFAVVAPQVIEAFALDLGTYRSGVQIARTPSGFTWELTRLLDSP